MNRAASQCLPHFDFVRANGQSGFRPDRVLGGQRQVVLVRPAGAALVLQVLHNPELELLHRLPAGTLVDGELVLFDAAGPTCRGCCAGTG